jgi:aspartate aminotransferase
LPGVDFGFEKEELFFRIAFVDFNGKKIMDAFQPNEIMDTVFIQKYAPNVYLGVNKIKEFVLTLKA